MYLNLSSLSIWMSLVLVSCYDTTGTAQTVKNKHSERVEPDCQPIEPKERKGCKQRRNNIRAICKHLEHSNKFPIIRSRIRQSTSKVAKFENNRDSSTSAPNDEEAIYPCYGLPNISSGGPLPGPNPHHRLLGHI